MPDWKVWAEAMDDRQPIYLQIIDRFKGSVIKGEMPPGHRVPSIRDVAVAMRVNPNTVHRAYQEMEREGLIFSQRGMGYFVTEDVAKMNEIKAAMAKGAIERFMQDMRAMGFTDRQILDVLSNEIKKAEAGEGDKDE